MKYKTRRRLSLLLLLVWMPLYIVVTTTIMSSFETRPHIALEVAIYGILGILWALPFKAVFKGVGREAPPDE